MHSSKFLKNTKGLRYIVLSLLVVLYVPMNVLVWLRIAWNKTRMWQQNRKVWNRRKVQKRWSGICLRSRRNGKTTAENRIVGWWTICRLAYPTSSCSPPNILYTPQGRLLGTTTCTLMIFWAYLLGLYYLKSICRVNIRVHPAF